VRNGSLPGCAAGCATLPVVRIAWAWLLLGGCATLPPAPPAPTLAGDWRVRWSPCSDAATVRAGAAIFADDEAFAEADAASLPRTFEVLRVHDDGALARAQGSAQEFKDGGERARIVETRGDRHRLAVVDASGAEHEWVAHVDPRRERMAITVVDGNAECRARALALPDALTRAAILGTLKRSHDVLEGCAQVHEVHGTLPVRIVYAPSGDVAEAVALGPVDDAGAACALRAAGAVRMPATVRGGEITLPLRY
jgi:hypothetical protein